MIRFLAINLFVIVFLSSCSLKTTEGLRQVPLSKTLVENPYFSNPKIDYVYKARIEAYGRNLGGILIIKRTGPENHRVVFTTEFGSKLFDFQFEGNIFTKNFVVEDLDRKFIINVLRDDFKLLLNEDAKIVNAYVSENHNVYKTKGDSRFNFYFFPMESGNLAKIVNTTKSKEKVTVYFTSSDGRIAEKITIKHKNIKLLIDLEKFNRK